MMDVLKNWIISILCLGIIVSFLELIIPKGKNKKYIYVLIGLLTIVTILGPIISYITNGKFLESVSNTLDGFTTKVSTDIDSTNLVKEEFVKTLNNDIESKLTLRGINVKNINITLKEDYNIEKISINIKKLSGKSTLENVNKIVEYLKTEYDIDYSKVEIIEAGE